MSANDSTLGGEAHVNRELPEYLSHVIGHIPPTHGPMSSTIAQLASDVWCNARLQESSRDSMAEILSLAKSTHAAVNALNENQQTMGDDVKNLMAKIDGLTDGLAEQAVQIATIIELLRAQRDT